MADDFPEVPVEDPPGMNPTEEVGPQDAEARMEETEFKMSEEVDDKLIGTVYSMRDEVADAFPVATINVGVDPKDGLPTPMDTQQLATAVPFDARHLVCLEDESEYVEVFSEEDPFTGEERLPDSVQAAIWPTSFPPRKRKNGELIERPVPHPDYAEARSIFHSDGTAAERLAFPPDKVVRRWGATFVEDRGSLRLVRAKRQRCEYYKRMVAPNDDQPDERLPGHKIIFRRCTALRSNGGAFLSVRDEGVYACDHRMPPDPETVRVHLDEPDKKRANTPVEMVPLFNITQNDGDRG